MKALTSDAASIITKKHQTYSWSFQQGISYLLEGKTTQALKTLLEAKKASIAVCDGLKIKILNEEIDLKRYEFVNRFIEGLSRI